MKLETDFAVSLLCHPPFFMVNCFLNNASLLLHPLPAAFNHIVQSLLLLEAMLYVVDVCCQSNGGAASMQGSSIMG